MKFHQALLLLLTVAHPCHACPEYPGYVFMENKDIYGYDILPSPMSGNLQAIHDDCEGNSNCKAFNTWGYRKDTVVPLEDTNWGGTCPGVYIKCRDWADLKIGVEADTLGTSANPTPFFLCSGTHTAPGQIDFGGKNVTIGCSDPAFGCTVEGSGPVREGFVGNGNFNVALSNLTLQDFNAAVDARDGIVTVERCNFRNNELGLNCEDGVAIVTFSEFEENTPTGAIQVTGGCSAAVSWSIFTDNESYIGGALQCSGSSTSCAIDNSAFDNNTATELPGLTLSGRGGAIHCLGSATCDIDLDSCSFQENWALEGPDVYCDSTSTCNL